MFFHNHTTSGFSPEKHDLNLHFIYYQTEINIGEFTHDLLFP